MEHKNAPTIHWNDTDYTVTSDIVAEEYIGGVNPVNWNPWSVEAFAQAKAENKPVFLSIGYS